MRRLPCVVLAVTLAACGPSGIPVTLEFAGVVGSEPARCGGIYPGIGASGTELRLSDFRLYVHDIRLVTEDGREVPLALDGSPWQHQDVAMLDFEDGSAECESGTAATNTQIRGTVPEDARFGGLRMRLGIPAALNHADAASAPSPLSFTSMFWGWNAGYKFLRVDGFSTGQPMGLRIHVGSTGCEGDGRGNVTGCALENRAEIALDGMDPTADTVSVNLATLLSDMDLDVDGGGQAGCMSGIDDPDCGPLFDALGLEFGGVPASGPQRLFRP